MTHSLFPQDSKLNHITPDHLARLLEKLMDDSDSSKSGAAGSSRVFSNKGCSLLARRINTASAFPRSRGMSLFLKSPSSVAGVNSGKNTNAHLGNQ